MRNPYPHWADLSFLLPFPERAATISNAQLMVNHQEPPGVRYGGDGIELPYRLGPNAIVDIMATYHTQGTNNYIYALNHDRRIEELNLKMVLTGADEIEFPPTTLHPTTKKKTEKGLDLSWNFRKLITRYDIGIVIPPKPGQTQKLAIFRYLAPLFLILFLGSLRFNATAENVPLKTHHYPLLGICFFIFYPLMFVLSSYIPITWSFLLSLTIITLVILSLLKKITSPGFALKKGVIILGVFLLLCTLAVLTRMMSLFFTLGGIILIAIFIWTAISVRTVPVVKTTSTGEKIDESCDSGLSELLAGLRLESATSSEISAVSVSEEIRGFCTFCGQDIAIKYDFCPSCGRGVAKSLTCYECGRELCAECSKNFRFCPECGSSLKRKD